jgi:hypothetical protein
MEVRVSRKLDTGSQSNKKSSRGLLFGQIQNASDKEPDHQIKTSIKIA